MLEIRYQEFYDRIKAKIACDKIFTDKLHTLAYGTDASFYRLIPKIVIKADNADEVKAVLELSNELNLSVTFKAAGTSLSGQAISDSILVITSRKFSNFAISEDKSYISLQSALTGAQANNLLAPFGKKIGPDPASINSAMIGGIAANNASGMCCGITDNSYKTLKSMKLIFQDGTKLDTNSEESKDDFRKTHGEFLRKLKKISNDAKENKELKELITQKYKIKNTSGYSINSLIDYDDEFDILQHLIIGSEGTLAFIEEITYYTVEDYQNKASALIYFEDIVQACNAVTALKLAKDGKKISVDAVELIDRAGLRAIEEDKSMPIFIKDFDENVTALLIETRAIDDKALDIQIVLLENLLKQFNVVRDIYFTKNIEEYTSYWNIRKGLFPAVGAVRKNGTTVIIEDVAYPIEQLANATINLQELFKKHNYEEAIIFGHALEGNFHFVFTQDFSNQREINRYNEFMQDVVQSVAVTYKGSLKAEHGTGRNMASFIEIEWGEAAYNIMKEIKTLFDPKNLLNPGVIINDDKQAHIKNLKEIHESYELINKCIECGFCEPTCPSNELTLTPRQRIVVNRHISYLKKNSNFEEAEEYSKLYLYDGLETCATCGLCSLSCPVKIDTGTLTKQIREEISTPFANNMATKISNNFNLVLKGMKFALGTVNLTHSILGTSNLQSISKGIRKLSNNKIPLWSKELPKPAKPIYSLTQLNSDKKVVYFSSCINRNLGRSSQSTQEEDLFNVTCSLLQKAGYEILFPKNIQNLCCGMPFLSKGYKKQGKQKSNELELALNEVSNFGKIPILCDTSPCTKTMIENLKTDFKLYEPIEFTLKFLVNELNFNKIDEPITIHTTCSSRKMGLENKFKQLAKLCSSEVIVPPNVKCCGFAGDRGFFFPELNESALSYLKEETKNAKYAFSTSKTCEIGLSKYSGLDYNSILYLVNKVTKSKLQT